MIDRIVLVKLKAEHASDEGRAAVAEETVSSLRGLPRVVALDAGVPSDERTAGVWDLYIRARFEDAADVGPYLVSPEHRAYVDGFLRPRMSAIQAFNFEVG